MRRCGRSIDASAGGNRPAGQAMNIEDPAPIGYCPVLDLNDKPNLDKRGMGWQGGPTRRPYETILTTNGTGGCIPFCAAEVTPAVVGQAPRTVEWIYLAHGHGSNLGTNLVTGNANPANIHVVFVVYDGASGSFGYAHDLGLPPYMKSLDPNNQIPDANAMIIYGPYSSLGITPQATIGILLNNRAPRELD